MKRIVACQLAVVFFAAHLFAWGPKGHRIVADIARDHLTNAARQNLQSILGNDDLAAIANWPDEVREQRPESSGWHYVDIPREAAGFSEARDCYRPDEKYPTSKDDHQNCVVDRIAIFRQVLADTKAPPQQRLEALKFVVHFVGDLHQPLHAIAEGRGGSEIHISEFGASRCGNSPCNLHAAWDSALIEHTGRSEQEYVAYLEKMIVARNLQARSGGTPVDWANESHRLARVVWLDDGGTLDEAYYEADIGIVNERLALAGLRLAALLNDAVGDHPHKLKGTLAGQ